MPLQFLLVLLLAVLLEQCVCTRAAARQIQERVYIRSFSAPLGPDGTITFPSSSTLPPLFRSLVLTPTDDNFTVTGPYLTIPASARLVNPRLLFIKFDVPTVRVFFAFRRRGSSVSLRGNARHLFVRPFGMRLHRSKLSVDAGIDAATKALDTDPTSLRLVRRVDHAKAASSVNLMLAPSSLLVFSAVDSGPIWPLFPVAGLDLPLEIAVISSPLGVVYVGWNANSLLRQRAQIPANRGAFRVLLRQDRILARIASAAAGRFLSPGGLCFDIPRIPVGDENGVKIDKVEGDPVAAFEGLIEALEVVAPVKISYQVSHDEEAEAAGLPTRGRVNRVVVFGNPMAGTPLMQQSFTAALDLPLKIAVWTEAASTNKITVAYTTLEWIGLRHKVEVPGMLRMALEGFANAAADAAA